MKGKTKSVRSPGMANLTLEAACRHYLLAKKRENCSEGTIALYGSWLSRWRKFLKTEGFSENLGDLTLAHGRRFSDHLHGVGERFAGHPFAEPKSGGLSCHTIHQAIRILRSFGNWLYRNDYTETHVFQDLELPRLKKRMIEVLTEDEIHAILKAADEDTTLGARNYALLVLGLDTGLRQGEMCGLRLRDVNWDQRIMKVNGKGDKERFVPFGATAEAALRRYVDIYRPEPYYTQDDFVFLSNVGTQVTGNGVIQLMRRLSESSGVRRLHCHLLRHTFAVNYLINGGDIVTLQMILGHEDLETTRIYLQLAQSHVTLQHNRFSPMDNMKMDRPGRRSNGNRGRRKARHIR